MEHMKNAIVWMYDTIHTGNHISVGYVGNCKQMWRNLITPPAQIQFDSGRRVYRKPLVWIDGHAEQSRISLKIWKRKSRKIRIQLSFLIREFPNSRETLVGTVHCCYLCSGYLRKEATVVLFQLCYLPIPWTFCQCKNVFLYSMRFS